MPTMYKTRFVFTLLLAVTTLDNASGQVETPSSAITSTKVSVTFDPKTCTSGTGGLSTGVEGARVKVLGHKGGFCEFEYVTDGCGGCFAYYLCRVPLEGGLVRIEVENGSIKTSLKPEQMKLVRTTGPHVMVLVGDTGEYVWHNNSQRASDMIPARGERVRYRFSLYTTEEFKDYLPGTHFDAQVEFVVGTGTMWPWLEAGAENMSVGERRQMRVPAKIGTGVKEWLPKEYSDKTIYVEAALVNLEHAK
jgi:hypothetical protein